MADDIPENPSVKKRGRPPTDNAMTPAERKRAQRGRDAQKIYEMNDYSTATLSALLEQLPKLIASSNADQVEAITAELNRRAKS